MTKVTYVRHGQASLFSENYDQLSDLGYRQARAIGEYFLEHNFVFDKIYLGPLQRHQQTWDEIRNCFPQLNEQPVIVLEGLKEHQGYKSLKSLLPQLLAEDKRIQELIQLPYSNLEDQIKHHIRIYDHFAQRWAVGEFDDMLSHQFQTWKQFYEMTKAAYQDINLSTYEGEDVLVITSGGPTSVAYGLEKNLSEKEILRFSSRLYNGSLTSFFKSNSGKKEIIANCVHHFKSPELHTLV